MPLSTVGSSGMFSDGSRDGAIDGPRSALSMERKIYGDRKASKCVPHLDMRKHFEKKEYQLYWAINGVIRILVIIS